MKFIIVIVVVVVVVVRVIEVVVVVVVLCVILVIVVAPAAAGRTTTVAVVVVTVVLAQYAFPDPEMFLDKNGLNLLESFTSKTQLFCYICLLFELIKSHGILVNNFLSK